MGCSFGGPRIPPPALCAEFRAGNCGGGIDAYGSSSSSSSSLLPSMRLKEGMGAVSLEEAVALGVVGDVGFEKIGSGGGSMALRSMSTFLDSATFAADASFKFGAVSSGIVVVILGGSVIIVGGASRFDSGGACDGKGRRRNHSRRKHGGCL